MNIQFIGKGFTLKKGSIVGDTSVYLTCKKNMLDLCFYCKKVVIYFCINADLKVYNRIL